MARDHVSMGVKSLLLTLFSATDDIGIGGGAAPEPSPWNILSYIMFKVGQLVHAFEGFLTNLAADLVFPFKTIWNFIVLKLEEIFHAFESFFTNLAADLVFPFKAMWNFIVLKLEEIFHAFESFFTNLAADLVFPFKVMWNFIVLKLEELIHAFEVFFTNIAANLEAFPLKEIWRCTVLKMKEFLHAFEGLFTNLAAKLEAFPVKETWEYIVVKLRETVHTFEDFFAHLSAKIFPPETWDVDKIREWAVVAAPFLLVGVGTFLVVMFIYCSCVREAICGLLGALGKSVKAVYSAMATAIGWLTTMLTSPAAVELMKAPGRGGVMISRAVFEANPTKYFRDLRAGMPLLS